MHSILCEVDNDKDFAFYLSILFKERVALFFGNHLYDSITKSVLLVLRSYNHEVIIICSARASQPTEIFYTDCQRNATPQTHVSF